jgi:Glycosyl transferase family 2
LEWVAYHRAIGVETIFLYTNDNDDGSDRLLAALSRAGMLEWLHNQVAMGGNAQHKAYGHALGLRPEVLNYRWALIIDLDEYLVLNPTLFRSAPDFLHWQESAACDAIALNWVVHGPAGASRWQDDLVVRRFPYETGQIDPHIKTLLRPRYFIHSTPHFPQTWRNLPFTFRGSNGCPHVPRDGGLGSALSAEPNADFAWVNHYLLKSTEEFLWKWSRNRGNYATLREPSSTVLTASFVNLFMQEFGDRIPERASPEQCAPGFAEELERLMALPDVAGSFAYVKRVYSERIKTIIPLFVNAPGIIDAGPAGKALMATLGL